MSGAATNRPRQPWEHLPVQCLQEACSSSSASNPEASPPQGGEASCLGSSSLDPLETTQHARYLLNRCHARVHGRSVMARAKIIGALHRSGEAPLLKRARCLCLCSSNPAVTVDASGVVRVRAIRCRDRLCPTCEHRRIDTAARRVAQQVETFDSVRMLTLTITDHGEGLRAQIDRLLKAFQAFRRLREWKRHVTRGVYALQVTRSQSGSAWHAHLHVLIEGNYWGQARISDRWRELTGDSPVVDIRAIHSRTAATGYVTRYVTRGDSIAQWDPETLCEYARAMKGVRLFQSFGPRSEVHVEEEAAEDDRPSGEASVSARVLELWARNGCGQASEAIAIIRAVAPSVGSLFAEDVGRERIPLFCDENAARSELFELLTELSEAIAGKVPPGPAAIPPRPAAQGLLFRQTLADDRPY